MFLMSRFFNRNSGTKLEVIQPVQEKEAVENIPVVPEVKVKDLSLIFSGFAGREVSVREEARTSVDRETLERKTSNVARLANLDEVILLEVEKAAADNDLEVRFILPGMKGIDDERIDRVNAYVEKSTDGKWRISNRFEIG
jgi:hypothetical protein